MSACDIRCGLRKYRPPQFLLDRSPTSSLGCGRKGKVRQRLQVGLASLKSDLSGQLRLSAGSRYMSFGPPNSTVADVTRTAHRRIPGSGGVSRTERRRGLKTGSEPCASRVQVDALISANTGQVVAMWFESAVAHHLQSLLARPDRLLPSHNPGRTQFGIEIGVEKIELCWRCLEEAGAVSPPSS
jgi:hypothetical protein